MTWIIGRGVEVQSWPVTRRQDSQSSPKIARRNLSLFAIGPSLLVLFIVWFSIYINKYNNVFFVCLLTNTARTYPKRTTSHSWQREHVCHVHKFARVRISLTLWQQKTQCWRYPQRKPRGKGWRRRRTAKRSHVRGRQMQDWRLSWCASCSLD